LLKKKERKLKRLRDNLKKQGREARKKREFKSLRLLLKGKEKRRKLLLQKDSGFKRKLLSTRDRESLLKKLQLKLLRLLGY
jgi:hypothetical protein